MNKPISERFNMDHDALAQSIFEPYAHQFIQKRSYDERNQLAAQSFGQKGRDWSEFGEILATITNNPLWKTRMAVTRLHEDWHLIVGEAIAQNSRVGRLNAGELTIFVSSPAWATQLEYMKEVIIQKIHEHIKSIEVQQIRIIGPQPEPFKRKRY
ncbi:DciA family protein [Alloscardovia theropitheci]|nr:DUF721 domain-containing protein [Alloscardovia theropitheci]